jgi:hypothetical protein
MQPICGELLDRKQPPRTIPYTHAVLRSASRQATLEANMSSPAEGVKVGDRIAWFFAWGSYVQRVIAPAVQLVTLPDAVDFKSVLDAIASSCTSSHCPASC